MRKRFEVILNEFDEVEYIMDKEIMEDRDFADFIDFVEDVCKENEQLRDELTFLNKVISFFADNPMTKYSSKSELLEEMKLLEKMGLI